MAGSSSGVTREKIEKLILKIKKISKLIDSFYGTIRIISHYDCDGITSASIIAKTLFNEGKNFRLTFVKQLNESIIEEVSKEKNKLILILDCGSGKLESIQKLLLRGEEKVIICDHHQPQGEILADSLFQINPIDFGITENISAAGVSYLLSRALNPGNIEFSGLAIIGAIGDAQVGSVGADWGLFGLNKEILKDSQKAGKIKVDKGLRLWGRYTRPIHKSLEYSVDPYIPGISGSESASIQFLKETGIEPKKEGKWRVLADLSQEEQKKLASGIIMERIRGNVKNPDWIFGDTYELLDKNEVRDASEFATILNATGKLEKAYLGLGLCLNDKDSFSKVKQTLESYRREIGRGIYWVRKNPQLVEKTGYANYILAGKNISEHIISNVLSIIHRSGNLPKKPTFAFVGTDDGMVKISARGDDESAEKGVNLSEILSEAAKEVGGEGGGHKAAAGATIPGESEEVFIKLVEKRLKTLKEQQEYKESHDKLLNGKVVESGSEAGREAEEGDGREKTAKKMEGEGLVRYFGS